MAEKIISMRDAFREEILGLAKNNPNILVLTADMGSPITLPKIKEKMLGRVIQVGIAEPNMVSIAAGLALSGKIHFVFSFSFLFSMRALEQVRTDICYP